MWDNMLTVFMLNIGFVLVVGIGLYLPTLLVEINVIASFIGFAIGIILLFQYSGAASYVARNMVNYQTTGFRDFIGYFKETWKQSLFLAGVMVIHALIFFIAFQFYFGMGGLIGIAAMSIIFWVSVIWLIASQFFFPVRVGLDRNIKKIIRKCFIMFFDNTFFSLAITIGTVVIFLVSGFTAFLLPGITSILIWHQAGFKLRMLKYDYIEENPEEDRKKIPWDALLIDEKDRVGHRTLRGMIFPWKE